MRLLEASDEFNPTKGLVNSIPTYPILSHTWGGKDQDVILKEIADGSGKSKARYQKIRFCGEHASRNGVRYFWVDTCCINKPNNAELSEIPNSKYR
jgi:hypothetical protein